MTFQQEQKEEESITLIASTESIRKLWIDKINELQQSDEILISRINNYLSHYDNQ
jgi:ribosomal protein L20